MLSAAAAAAVVGDYVGGPIDPRNSADWRLAAAAAPLKRSEGRKTLTSQIFSRSLSPTSTSNTSKCLTFAHNKICRVISDMGHTEDHDFSRSSVGINKLRDRRRLLRFVVGRNEVIRVVSRDSVSLSLSHPVRLVSCLG